MRYCDILLFIILFLHQTTTDTYKQIVRHGCLSSCSYIKPQQSQGARASVEGCLSSCSYIKPQLHNNKTTGISVVYHLVPTSNHNHFGISVPDSDVVYHLVPTSNHNRKTLGEIQQEVVYHLVPTSNHNPNKVFGKIEMVVYHLVPTSNHNRFIPITTLYPVVYHLVPTSNHNRSEAGALEHLLFIILFLHQTTTRMYVPIFLTCCLSSCSYIKPQQEPVFPYRFICCLSSCSYIKPQLTRRS